MRLLKWLFGRAQTTAEAKKNNAAAVDESGFTIEFYPITQRYYPKYKNKYMLKESNSGIYGLKKADCFIYAAYSSSEQGAKDIISKYKEQQLKENVVTIKA